MPQKYKNEKNAIKSCDFLDIFLFLGYVQGGDSYMKNITYYFHNFLTIRDFNDIIKENIKGGNEMSKFRGYLGANVGNNATIWTNQFEVKYNPSGQMLLLINDYEIKKITNNRIKAPKPKNMGHLWVKIPDWLEEKCLDLEATSRKIEVQGKLHFYTYKDSDQKNVSIRVDSLSQVKPKRTKKSAYV